MPQDYRKVQRQSTGGGLIRRSRRHRVYAWSVVLGILGLGFVSLFWLRSVLMPFIISAIIVFLLAPFVDRLQKWRVPRWAGVLLSYLGIIIAVYLFFLYLVPKLEHESKKLVENMHAAAKEAPRYFRQLEKNVEEVLDKYTGDDDSLPALPPPGMRWGRGPAIEPIVGPGHHRPAPHLAELRFSVDPEGDEGLLASASGDRASSREAAHEAERSTLLVTEIRDGQYGVRLNESSVEVEQIGEGQFNISTKPGRRHVSTAANLREQIIDALRSGLEEIGGGIIGGVVRMVQSIVSGVVGAFIAVIVTFMVAAFVLIDLPHLRRFLRARIPPRYRSHYDDLAGKLNDGMSGVVRGQLFVCLFNGTLSFFGFLIFIPEYAVVMGILGGIMSIIPILGTIIATVPAVLVGLTVSFEAALGVFAWIMGVHFIEANLLSPKIVSSQAKLNPALIMFVIIAGQQMFGIKGALLAVPVASIIKSLVSFAYPRAERVIMSRG